MNVVTGVGTEKVKGKNTLKNQASLLKEGSKELFGKSFCKHMIATAKAKKESKEVYQKSNVSNSDKRPFRNTPHYISRMGCDLYHSQLQTSVEINQNHHPNHLKDLNHHGSQKDHLVRVSSRKKETFLNTNSLYQKHIFRRFHQCIS